MTDRTEPETAPRAIVIGARRRRQGIGEFVTRQLAAEGAEVCAIVGTSPPSVTEATRTLGRAGIEVRGYVDLGEAIEVEQPDLVAICSPTSAHREHLQTVSAAGVHCLCEKPLWWEDDRSDADRARETERLIRPFVESGKVLELLTQWPETLTSYAQLYPGVREEPLRTFELELGPVNRGPAMLLDAAPHGLSLLEALAGAGEISGATADYPQGPEGPEMRVAFHYTPREGALVEVRFRFVIAPNPPRPAAYAINGRWARRVIRLPEYAMELHSSDSRVALPDPLQRHVRGFLARLSPESGARDGSEGTNLARLKRSVTQLAQLHRAAETATEQSR